MTSPDTKPGRRLLPEFVWRILVFVLALTIIVVFATQWTRWEGAAGLQTTDDAYLQADLTPISARVPGYVREVSVDDFDHVRAGQLVAEIDDSDYRTAVAQAEAGVATAQAAIGTLQAQLALQQSNIRVARAVVAATEVSYTQSGRDLRREHVLLQTGSGAQSALEHAETAQAELAAELEQRRAQTEAAERQFDVLTAQLRQAEAALAAQQANLDLAKINLGYTRIIAPADGVIGLRQVQPGQYLGVGGQIAVLAPLPHLWVIANYKETQLTHIRVGEPATVTVDTFPGHTLRGKVIAMTPASGSEFALLPPDNATGNFTKVVQRMAVKISIDDADGLTDQLQAGMSVIATIDASGAPSP